jgi:hypothetical protein
VPGHNWANDTEETYQGLTCFGKTCDCGESPCGEFVFDFRNASMIEWWLNEHMGGATALGHPDVDGLILDDHWSAGGPSEIDSHCKEDTGLTAADVSAIMSAYSGAMAQLFQSIAHKGKFLAGGRDQAYSGDKMSTSNSHACLAKLSSMCSSTPSFGQWYAVDYTYMPSPDYGIAPTNARLDVAYFLLTRAPFAWIGGGPMFGWHMSHWWAENKSRPITYRKDLRPPEFNADYGVPTSNCTATTAGVFQRQWTKAVVSIDCTSMEGTIDPL